MSGEQIKEPETFRENCVKMLTHPATNFPRRMAEGIVDLLLERGALTEEEGTNSNRMQMALLRTWHEDTLR